LTALRTISRISTALTRAFQSRAFLYAFCLFVILRLSLSLLGFWGVETFPIAPTQRGPADTRDVPRIYNVEGYNILGIWQRWDALWYQKIAMEGYEHDPNSTAFFPLYPLLVRGVAWVLQGRYVLGALLVSNIAYLVAMFLLYRLASLDLSEDRVRRALLYVSIYPTAFFLLCGYTESLFLALTLGAFLAARRGRWWPCAALASLAALTRGPGVLLVLPLAYEFWQQRGIRITRENIPALGLLAIPAAFLLFQAYLRYVLGLPTTAQINTEHWGIEWALPWESLWASVKLHVAGKATFIDNFDLFSLVLFAVTTVVAWRRLRRSYAVYMAALLILYLTRLPAAFPLMSMSRFVLPLFPCFLVLARWGENRYLNWALVIPSAILLSFFAFQFTHWQFVG